MSAPTTPTAAALARLAAIDPPPDFGGPANELQPWLAAAAAGRFELPESIIGVVAMAAHVAEEQAANVKPQAHRAGDIDVILHGASVDEVIGADAAHVAALTRHNERERLLLSARRVLQGKVAEGFVPVRDSLIRVELRAAVAELLDKTRRLAGKMGRFAPNFDESELLAAGTAAELQAWRASRDLQADLETFIAAWRASWSAATGKGQAVGREYAPQRAGGYYAWADPEAVTAEALRLGHDSEVLRIATAASEYRLLAPSEVVALVDRMAADLPDNAPKPASWLVRAGVCQSGG